MKDLPTVSYCFCDVKGNDMSTAAFLNWLVRFLSSPFSDHYSTYCQSHMSLAYIHFRLYLLPGHLYLLQSVKKTFQMLLSIKKKKACSLILRLGLSVKMK